MINIATIGGGNGQAIALRALKQLKSEGAPFNITAIVSVADSGGSSGKLRESCGILPPGDLLRAVMALSSYDFSVLRAFFYEQRFASALPSLAGHSVGNLLIKYLCDETGSMVEALKILGALWNACGTVLPATLDNVELCAELENGKVVRGETNIDRPQYDPRIRKTRVWLESEGAFLPAARAAIENAHYIIIGPGDLFTSVLPVLLIGGAREAIAHSNARIIFVMCLANRLNGETRDFPASEHARVLHKYLGRECDMFIAHNAPAPREFAPYIEKGWQWIERDEGEVGVPVVHSDLEYNTRAGMDFAKLAVVLKSVLK